jgi:hypothetical protein
MHPSISKYVLEPVLSVSNLKTYLTSSYLNDILPSFFLQADFSKKVGARYYDSVSSPFNLLAQPITAFYIPLS